MRNTSGKSRKERKAERRAKQLALQNTYPPFWLNERHDSRAGKIYYNLRFNRYGLTPVYDNAG